MHYRTNWLVVILLALGLHGAVFGGLILVRPLLDGSAEEVASEVGTTIELEDAPQSGEGEETKDPGYEDGAEGGSLVGEALPGNLWKRRKPTFPKKRRILNRSLRKMKKMR